MEYTPKILAKTGHCPYKWTISHKNRVLEICFVRLYSISSKSVFTVSVKYVKESKTELFGINFN